MVRIAVIGAVPDPVEEYPDGSNTKSVKEDLLGGYGKGILKRNKVGVLTETLQAGEYEYYVTPQQAAGAGSGQFPPWATPGEKRRMCGYALSDLDATTGYIDARAATSAGSVLTGLAGEADIEITVRWRKTTCIVKLEANATFDNLKREICNNWDQLIPVDFAIYVDKKIITSDADLVLFLNSSDRVLKVETQTVDFSEIKLKTVKDWAGIGDIEEDKDQFGSAVIDESIPGVKAIIDHAVADLKLKDALYGPIIDCCEASVREYISAILTAAAGIATQIKLSAEREISGRKATGPLDYAMLYKQFCIAIITEAKRDRLSSGVVQNVAQLVASRETYLFNTQDRNRGYMDMAGQIAQVPSTGIISTGKEWLLLRYFLHPAPLVVKSAVYGLPIVEISTADTDCELRRHVLVLLGKIVGALSLQKEAFDANEFTKKQRV